MPNDVLVTRSGGPEVLALRERPAAPLGPGQVRIRVAFAGVNFADLAARAGVYGPAPKPPFAPGFEVAGTVVEAETGFTVGDRVLAATRFGGYTDELVIDGARVRRIPAAMSLEEAAALPAQYITAYHALTEVARVRKGESVLVHAVAGGVGTATVQLCKALGLVSFGTASTPQKLEFARGQGLDHGFGYEDFEGEVRRITGDRGVDVVMDANGGSSFGRSFRSLALGGRLIVFGAAAAMPASLFGLPRAGWEVIRQKWFHPFELIARNVSVSGLQVLLLWDEVELLGREIDELLRLYEAGSVRPVIDQVFPLADAAAAHRYLHERRTRGKVLLAA